MGGQRLRESSFIRRSPQCQRSHNARVNMKTQYRVLPGSTPPGRPKYRRLRELDSRGLPLRPSLQANSNSSCSHRSRNVRFSRARQAAVGRCHDGDSALGRRAIMSECRLHPSLPSAYANCMPRTDGRVHCSRTLREHRRRHEAGATAIILPSRGVRDANSSVAINKPEATKFILGQTDFIKSVKDLSEALTCIRASTRRQ